MQATGEASWEIPVPVPVAEVGGALARAALIPIFGASKGLQQQQQQQQQEEQEEGTLPVSVSEHFDQVTGQTYYFDSQTQESSWTRPKSRSKQLSAPLKPIVSANSRIAMEYLKNVKGSATVQHRIKTKL